MVSFVPVAVCVVALMNLPPGSSFEPGSTSSIQQRLLQSSTLRRSSLTG